MHYNSAWRWPLIGGVPILWIVAVLVGGNPGALFPLGLALLAGFGFLFWQAALGKHWALLTILLIAVIGLGITFRQREIGDPGLDGQTGLKILWWIGMLAVCLLRYDRLLAFINDRALSAFGCYCLIILLSAAYSPVPLVSLTSALGVTAYLLFGCLLARELDFRTIMVALLWSFAFVSILNVVAAFVAPDLAYLKDDPLDILKTRVPPVRLQGLMGQPNNLARFTSVYLIIVFAVAWRGYLRPGVWIPHSLLAVGVLWAAQSRTSIAALVLGLLLQLRRQYLLLLAFGGLVVTVVVLITGQLDTVLGLAGRDGTAEEALSMAGRADLWDFVWRLVTLRPIIGYGFNSFEAFAGTLWTGPTADGVAAHNNYLSVIYSTGLLGTIPFLSGFAILLYRRCTTPEILRDFFTANVLITGFSEIDCFSSISFVPTLIYIVFLAADSSSIQIAARRLDPEPAEPNAGDLRGRILDTAQLNETN